MTTTARTFPIALLLTLLQQAADSASGTTEMHGEDPAIAEFALAVAHLELHVGVTKRRFSADSKLVGAVTLTNHGSQTYEMFVQGGTETPYRVVLEDSASPSRLATDVVKDRSLPRTMFIEPGRSYQDFFEVDLTEMDVVAGAHTVEAHFSLHRMIGGKLRSIYLQRRSRLFEIVAPGQSEEPGSHSVEAESGRDADQGQDPDR